jgi:hypothetical protein
MAVCGRLSKKNASRGIAGVPRKSGAHRDAAAMKTDGALTFVSLAPRMSIFVIARGASRAQIRERAPQSHTRNSDCTMGANGAFVTSSRNRGSLWISA